MQHAAESARTMVEQSPILQACVAAMIISRRLYMVVRGVLDNEIVHGWECDDPELVINTLGLSAQEKANENFSLIELQQSMLTTIVPFLDIIQQHEEAAQPPETNEPNSAVDTQSAGATPETLPGGVDGATS